MFINKVGYSHVETGTNCQDFGFEKDGIKCVADGCSEGDHSEVGAKLFCHLFRQGLFIDECFVRILHLIGYAPRDMRDYMCFTILHTYQTKDEFLVLVCGDGYIVKQTVDDKVEYELMDNGKYPMYYIYNYIPKEYLASYKDGVNFTLYKYSKKEYKNVGVASDGLRFVIGTDLEEELTNLIVKGKESAIKRFINKNHKVFKDDITIVI